MGLIKAEQSTRKLHEVFPPGTPFRLHGGELKGTAKGSFGERLVASVTVSAVTELESLLQFGVWGPLAEQLTQVEPGELPAIVTLSNSSGIWQFTAHGPEPIEDPETGESMPQRVNPEAHLDLEGGPTDSALGAVAERSAPPPPPVDPGGIRNPVSTEPPSVKPTDLDESQTFQPGQP